MNDDRQLSRARQFHLLQEDSLLDLSRRMIIKIVEADFSPGDDFGMARPLLQVCICCAISKPCLVRMNADTRPDFRVFLLSLVLFGQANAAVGSVRAFAVSNRQISFDPVLFRPGQHLVPIMVVTLAFEMCVGVDEHV